LLFGIAQDIRHGDGQRIFRSWRLQEYAKQQENTKIAVQIELQRHFLL
jgi:hypothetical protein